MLNNRLAWASPGHTNEYCFNTTGDGAERFLDERGYIRERFENALREALGVEFYVSNRGTRLEILVAPEMWVDRETATLADGIHDRVHSAVESVFGPTDLVVNQLQPRVFTCMKDGCDAVLTRSTSMEHMRTHFKLNA